MNILLVGQNSKMAHVLSLFSNVTMVIDQNIETYRSYSENEKFRIIVSKTDIRMPLSIPKRTLEIRKWVRNTHADVVFTNDKFSMIAAKIAVASLKTKPKLISTSHNSYAWQTRKRIDRFARVVQWTTDGYVALTSFVYAHLSRNGLSSRKLLFLPNTIEFESFVSKTDYSIRGPVKIVYTAVVCRPKGQHLLLEAVRILKETNRSVRIDFIGEPVDADYKTHLDEYIRENNLEENVSFKGRVENDLLKNALCQYDIYVSASLMEMSPFNVLEAKAAALPIVANKVGGIPDLISDYQDGLLIAPASPEKLATALSRLIGDETLRHALGQQARKNISTVQSPRMAAKKIRAFISQL